MNKIILGGITFTDDNILEGNCLLSNALVAETLGSDTLTFSIYNSINKYDELIDSEDENVLDTTENQVEVKNGFVNILENTTYGDPLYYYYNDNLIGKFYIQKVIRTGRYTYKFQCLSAIGLLANIRHYGGIYVGGISVGDLVEEIFGDITYTIDTDVANTQVYGWLPIASCRDNLQQILFAVGASVMKDEDGDVYIKYLRSGTPSPLADEKLFINGSIDYLSPATNVEITEHAFYALNVDQEVLLFDNTDGSGTATNQLVMFENPCHNLTTEGLTIINSGANFAVVSGTGVLYGKQYTHTTKSFSIPTGVRSEKKVISVDNATLVSTANSANVASRVASYYSTAREVNYGMVMDNEKPGKQVSFTDPFGDHTSGFIKEMDFDLSGKLTSDTKFAINWLPSDFGNNYSNYVLLTQSGTWTVPAGVSKIKVVIAGGGNGGQGGYDGKDETEGPVNAPSGYREIGGEGGEGGEGGTAGKVLTVEIQNPNPSYSYTIGTGGVGGNPDLENPTLGTQGTPSTFGTYSSTSGTTPQYGVVNALTGDVYSEPGIHGFKGGDGGGNDPNNIYHFLITDRNFCSTPYGLWHPGVGYNGESMVRTPAGGGGASFGSDGDNGSSRQGGWGAPALPTTAYNPSTGQPYLTVSLGSGGPGGNGGGGGGLAVAEYAHSSTGEYEWIVWNHAKGVGGSGSVGSDGGDGYIIIYY